MMIRYLLDTHAFVFWLLEPQKLSHNAIDALRDSQKRFHIATITILEIEYLIEINRIQAQIDDFINYVSITENFNIIPYGTKEMIKSVSTKGHRDPFDRIIVGTAIANDLTLITKDSWMTAIYSKCIW